MPERKGVSRGYPFDDYEALRERKQLKGRPPWKGWKPTLIKYLRVNRLGSINSKEDPHLHERYVLGVKHQLGQVSKEEVEAYEDRLKEEHPELFENPAFVLAIEFIGKRTQKPGV